MKLKVGHTYLDRLGNKRKIVSFNNERMFPYRDDAGNNLTPDGSYFYTDTKDDRDLIKDVTPWYIKLYIG